MKHRNYEILNLIGYGLAKFGNQFVKDFGYESKTKFYDFCVSAGIAETGSTIKNRQDLFDPFFDNGRKGWWQKGDAYIHRKIFIDSLFGELDVKDYVNVIKLYMRDRMKLSLAYSIGDSPIIKSKFKQLQATGGEAELFFMNNFFDIELFENGLLEDARMLGDGYDFQIQIERKYYLAEIKGIRQSRGAIRMTDKEYRTAKIYKDDYALVVVSNLSEIPQFQLFLNPTVSLHFVESLIRQDQLIYKATI